MAQASGVNQEILSLPSGGGSVSGIGPAFDVDLNTGTASSSVPFELPPGPNGVRPELSLRYHSGAGDGVFGIGWSLSLPVITREPRAGDLPPVYTLEEVGRLRPTSTGVWRPEVDNLSNLIRHDGDADGWDLIDTNDTVHSLGAAPQSRLPGSDGAPVMWVLDRIADAFGNAVEYGWRLETGQLYVDQVRWGTWLLAFVYEPRPDWLLAGNLGVLIETRSRCRRIELRSPSLGAPLLRSWDLTYDDEDGLGRSLLSSVSVTGHAEDGTALSSPPIVFSYTRPEAASLVSFSGWNPGSLRSKSVSFVDLSGDGLPDALDLGAGEASVWRNLGRFEWSGPHRLNGLPSPLRLDSSSVSFGDMNGDGAADLLMLSQPTPGYYPFNTRPWTRPDSDATEEGLFDRPVLWRQAPGYSLASPDVRVLDLNGDFLTDLLVDTGRSWMAWTQDGSNGWTARPSVLPASVTPPVRLRDQRVFIADLTGDGHHDVVRLEGNLVRYWPSLGYARWGEARTMSIEGFPQRLDPARIALIDVDGDGCADVVYVDTGRVLVWRNTGSNRFTGPQEIRGTPVISPDGFRVIDIDGSAAAGILFDLAFPGVRRSQCFLKLTGGRKPYLLNNIDHGTGAFTAIEYRASTEFALDDRNAGDPWLTFHPFPVHCVSAVTRTDAPSGATLKTVYRYHDGRFDPVSRTFIGFGRVSSDAIGDDSAPTLRTTSQFHIGLDPSDPFRALTPEERLAFGALRRRPIVVTILGVGADGAEQNPLTITRYAYDTKVTPALDASSVVLPFTSSTIEERWDGQPALVSTHTIAFIDVDDRGVVRRQRSTVTAADGTVARDLFIEVSMATGGANLSLPARAAQTDAGGNFVALSINFYDGPDHIGLPEGTATQGALRRTEDFVLTDDLVTAVWGAAPPDLASLGYHRLPGETGWWVTRASRAEKTEAGAKVLVSRGPRGAETTLRMDPTGQFVDTITDAAGNSCSAAYDPRSGQVSRLTDENGVSRQDLFDSLGRVTGTLFPGDPAGAPSQFWTYRTESLPLRIDAFQRTAIGAVPVTASITYFDGMGKVLARVTPAGNIDDLPPGAAAAWIVSQARRLNSRGLVSASWLPYLSTTDALAPPSEADPHVLLSYNAAGQVIREDRPDGQIVVYERAASSITVSSGTAAALAPRERHEQDACGQVTSVARFDGARWVAQTYEWDARGRIAAVTTPDGARCENLYDLRGRPILTSSPESGETRRLYDANGSEVLRRNAAGQEVRREYDALRRPVSVNYSGGATPDVSFEFLDSGSPAPPDGTRFRIGRLWKVTDPAGETTAAYDELGRCVSSVRSGGPVAGRFETTLTYDRLGRIVDMLLPSIAGARPGVAYSYDDAGRPLSASGVVTDAVYDIWGRIVRLRYANGVATENSFDPLSGRLVKQRITASDGTLITSQDAAYSDKGDLISLTDLAGTTTFDYDGLLRLTGVTRPAAAPETYVYSDGGNMTLGPAGPMTYSPASGLLLTAGGLGYTHDSAGRLAAAPWGTLAFNASDHLVNVGLAGGDTLDHAYDYLDRHVMTRHNGAIEFLALGDHTELRSGVAVQWLTFAGRRLVAVNGAQKRWLHPDLRSNVSLVTDDAGRVVFRSDFAGFGLPVTPGGPGQPGAGFLGAAADASGLICLGLRWYDPRLGRFISPDPMVAGIYLIDAWNPYVYAHNNPVLFADPAGAWSFWGVLAVAVLVAVVVVAAVFTGGAALAGLGVLATAISTQTLVAVGIGAFGGALAGGLSAMNSGGSVWGGAILGGIIGGATALAGGAVGSSLIASYGKTYAGFILSGIAQGATGGFGTGFAVGFAGGKGTLGAALLSAVRGAIWGAVLGGVLGGGSRFLFVGGQGEHNYFEFLTFNRYLPDKPGDFYSALNVGDNAAGTVEDGFISGTHMARGTLGGSDVGDIIDVTTIRDIGAQTYKQIGGATIAFFSDGSVVMVNLTDVANALSTGGIELGTSASVTLDANGFSYASQFALLLKNIPLLGNFLALADERKYGLYEEATKGFDAFFGSRAGSER